MGRESVHTVPPRDPRPELSIRRGRERRDGRRGETHTDVRPLRRERRCDEDGTTDQARAGGRPEEADGDPGGFAAGIATVIGALALGAGNPALASGKRAFGDVSVFASAPAPATRSGSPSTTSGSTSRRAPATSSRAHQNSDDERVFTYDEDGKLVDTTVIDTAENSDMGLFGLALDGNRARTTSSTSPT